MRTEKCGQEREPTREDHVTWSHAHQMVVTRKDPVSGEPRRGLRTVAIAFFSRLKGWALTFRKSLQTPIRGVCHLVDAEMRGRKGRAAD